jgi:hypothetical protein
VRLLQHSVEHAVERGRLADRASIDLHRVMLEDLVQQPQLPAAEHRLEYTWLLEKISIPEE